MGDERCFVPIGLVDGNLPVPGVSIKSRKDVGLSERVDAVVHTRDGICFPDRTRVQFTIVNTEAGGAILFGNDRHGAGPFRHRRFDNALRETAFDLGLDKGARTMSGTGMAPVD